MLFSPKTLLLTAASQANTSSLCDESHFRLLKVQHQWIVSPNPIQHLPYQYILLKEIHLQMCMMSQQVEITVKPSSFKTWILASRPLVSIHKLSTSQTAERLWQQTAVSSVPESPAFLVKIYWNITTQQTSGHLFTLVALSKREEKVSKALLWNFPFTRKLKMWHWKTSVSSLLSKGFISLTQLFTFIGVWAFDFDCIYSLLLAAVRCKVLPGNKHFL